MTPPPNHTIRPATPRDAAAVVEFILEEAREAEGRDLEREVVARGVADAIGGNVPRCWVLCGDEGTVVGCCSIYVEWSDWHAAPYWWVQSFFLAPSVRGGGLAGRMIDHLTEEARRAGAIELRLYADRGNARALAAYRKAGFAATNYEVLIKSV
jgi:GNAT superfamily N-acetyltransferase